jgi:hypothetical protein
VDGVPLDQPALHVSTPRASCAGQRTTTRSTSEVEDAAVAAAGVDRPLVGDPHGGEARAGASGRGGSTGSAAGGRLGAMTNPRPNRSTAPGLRRRTPVRGAAVLLLLAVVAGCATEGGQDVERTTTTASSTTDESTTTTGPDGDQQATMTPADGWTDVDESMLPRSVVAAYAAPDGSPGFRDNVNLLVEEGKADDLDAYWDRSEESLASVPGVKEIEPQSDTEMDGQPAYQKVWSARTAGRRLRFWSVVTAVDGDGYVFTYTALPDSFDDHRADAREMFESIDLPA